MNSFPQVLLLGNGINLLHNMYQWKDVLKKINVNPHISVDDLTSPMPLQAILVTNDNIDNILKAKAKDKNSEINFHGKITCEEQRKLLQEILCMGFEHILTTNYSYELELAGLNLPSDISDYQLKKISNHTTAVEKVEPKYMLHCFNQITYNSVENKIWHIHGEARKIDSSFDVQKYASQYGLTNESELFAEAFANSQLGEPNVLGQAMNKWLEGQGF